MSVFTFYLNRPSSRALGRGWERHDEPTFGSILALLMLCTMSLIDLIVPFLSSVSGQLHDKDCNAGHVVHLEVAANEELTSHICGLF
jgi:hypothetical protein